MLPPAAVVVVFCGCCCCCVAPYTRRGPFTLGALQDFAGDKLLHLPRIQQVYPGNLEIFLANTPPTKVVALVMARSGGGGSLALRAAVHALRYLVDFARVNLADPGIGQQDKEASAGAQLQALLRLQQAPPHNSIVFLRGPGLSLPHVLPLQPGDVRKLDELITSQGLIYHTMPPLRKLNAEGMGCTAARDRAEVRRCPSGAPSPAVAPPPTWKSRGYLPRAPAAANLLPIAAYSPARPQSFCMCIQLLHLCSCFLAA